MRAARYSPHSAYATYVHTQVARRIHAVCIGIALRCETVPAAMGWHRTVVNNRRTACVCVCVARRVYSCFGGRFAQPRRDGTKRRSINGCVCDERTCQQSHTSECGEHIASQKRAKPEQKRLFCSGFGCMLLAPATGQQKHIEYALASPSHTRGLK